MAVIDRTDPRRKGPPPYVFQAWPSWRYGPNGQSQIFQSEDEVPEGWVDHPSKVGKSKSTMADDLPDDDARVSDLVAGHSQSELVGILETARENNANVEFLANWPKLKLAKTIIAHNIKVEDD